MWLSAGLRSRSLCASRTNPAACTSRMIEAGSMRWSMSVSRRPDPGCAAWSMMTNAPPGFSALNTALLNTAASVGRMNLSCRSW